jgi:hypothetical protein
MSKFKILLVLLFFSSEAFAYIDPGSGSAITAAIIAFLSGIYFYIKKYFYKIKNILKKILRID